MIQINLFIFNFKKHSKMTIRALVLLLAVLWLGKLLDFLYVREDEWARILWNNFYQESANIDNLYLGSSHVFCGINPSLLDELNGQNNFNLSTSSQRLNSSYYLLKEASRKNDLSHVYLELYYGCTTGDMDINETYLASSWCNTDYMNNSLNKLKFMLSIGTTENYLETFIPFLRFKSKLFDTEHVREMIEIKESEKYKNYEYVLGVIEYRPKGYYYTTGSNKYGLAVNKEDLSGLHLSQSSEFYLRKIIEFCQKEGIGITLFSAPVYGLKIMGGASDYDNYVEQVKGIAREYQLPYFDFNLCKEEYLPELKADYFWDLEHLNNQGAELYTCSFYEVLQKETDSEKCFYDSYEKKMKFSKKTIYGLFCGEEKESLKNYTIASSLADGMEYRITLFPEGNGEMELLQDYSINMDFSIPVNEYGICKIEAREIKNGNNFEILEVNY